MMKLCQIRLHEVSNHSKQHRHIERIVKKTMSPNKLIRSLGHCPDGQTRVTRLWDWFSWEHLHRKPLIFPFFIWENLSGENCPKKTYPLSISSCHPISMTIPLLHHLFPRGPAGTGRGCVGRGRRAFAIVTVGLATGDMQVLQFFRRPEPGSGLGKFTTGTWDNPKIHGLLS